MGLVVKFDGDGQHFEPLDSGLHHAVCYAVYDLGTHYDERWEKRSRRVLIMWEVPNERIDIERDGKMQNLPRAISKRYTLSLHPKSGLRRDLEGWRGKSFSDDELAGFDLQNLLGANCMLQVVHKEGNNRTFANISSVSRLMKGLSKIEPENAPKFFSFDDGGALPEGTPEWVADIIHTADEWQQEYPEEPASKYAKGYDGIDNDGETISDDARAFHPNGDVPF